jgi:RNA polymerase sigma factor (sigma-70 family)
MGTDAGGLSRATLHRVLMPRIGLLRGYLEAHVPASLRSAIVVDDLLQEIWIAAYRTALGFQANGPDALDRWLIRIAHSKLVDAVRYARRRRRGGSRRPVHPAQGATSFSDVFTRLQAVQRTPSGEAHLMETAHAMLMALNLLCPRQRRAIELKFLQGFSPSEIAAELRTTEAAVKQLVYRGLEVLRGILGPAAKYFTDASSAEELPAGEAGHVQA